jgi:hypothetical protein
MIKKILIFEFHRNSEDVATDYELLSDIDKEKIADLEPEGTFDYEDEHGNYNCCLIITEIELEKYKNLLDENNIPYLCKDISYNVIKNDINLTKKLLKYTNNINENLYYDFIKKVDNWIVSNLELDIILDMINEKGINSLRKIDKEFLENYEKY